MIVTIDGPAGAGKSSTAKRLAERLGFEFLDTGALYRAATLAAVRAEIAPGETERLATCLEKLSIELNDKSVHMNGVDVTSQIRSNEIANQVRDYAEQAIVRKILTARSRELARGKNVVTEGRDQGTVVFPDAECKFFMTAADEERALRRQAEFSRRGIELDFEKVLSDQRERDRRDSERALAPLKRADDAIVIDTTGKSPEVVVELLERHVRARQIASQ